MRNYLVLALFAVAGCQSSNAAQSPTPSPSPTKSQEAFAPSRVDQLIARARELTGNRALEPDATLPDAKSDGAPRLASDDGKTTIEFPLAHTSVLADVTGNIARVEVTQLYQNPTAQRLEAIYQFPLPENAAVTDMMFRIGKRVVISEVKKRAAPTKPQRPRATPPR